MVAATAFLVLRDGSKWDEVFRLAPKQVYAIGRAPINHVVIRDDLCSRLHAEIFYSEQEKCWMLRDLQSRNGTAVNGMKIDPDADAALDSQDTIQIGRTQLLFLHDLNEIRPSPQMPVGGGAVTFASFPGVRKGGSSSSLLDDSHVLSSESGEDTMITYRRDRARLLERQMPEGDQKAASQRLRSYVSSLCRLAMEINKDVGRQTKLEMALRYLLQQLSLDTAGILLLPEKYEGVPEIGKLEIASAMSTSEHTYRMVSDFLAKTVLETGDAVLARHVMEDSILGRRDSAGRIDATSVICAPVRSPEHLWGLIHLYSTDPARVPDELDLDFALGVAEVLALTLDTHRNQQKLAESLSLAQRENDDLRKRLGVQSDIVGTSKAVADITEQIMLAANSKATVLIRGESGVGKELVARAVHYSSQRSKNPFICLNCAALAEDLLASELFGHEKGAFTGATERKIGKFEAAEGGSLMLDEIGEMSMNIQSKFLRVLEGHAFERVGGNKPIRVDVRVIAATNRDLEQEVMAGRFRKDLFFRLRVLEILVPPLRQRREDILVLAEHFFQMFKAETGRRLDGFTQAALDRLMEYDWPGNIRELKNVIERAVVLAKGERIDAGDLVLSNLMVSSDAEAGGSTILLGGGTRMNRSEAALAAAEFKPCSLEEIEAKHIRKMLRHTDGNKSRAAQLLGIERTTLDRKIRKYGLDGES